MAPTRRDIAGDLPDRGIDRAHGLGRVGDAARDGLGRTGQEREVGVDARTVVSLSREGLGDVPCGEDVLGLGLGCRSVELGGLGEPPERDLRDGAGKDEHRVDQRPHDGLVRLGGAGGEQVHRHPQRHPDVVDRGEGDGEQVHRPALVERDEPEADEEPEVGRRRTAQQLDHRRGRAEERQRCRERREGVVLRRRGDQPGQQDQGDELSGRHHPEVPAEQGQRSQDGQVQCQHDQDQTVALVPVGIAQREAEGEQREHARAGGLSGSSHGGGVL
jgi:hypothetical protein